MNIIKKINISNEKIQTQENLVSAIPYSWVIIGIFFALVAQVSGNYLISVTGAATVNSNVVTTAPDIATLVPAVVDKSSMLMEPGTTYYLETSIVVWGKNLNSSVGLGRFTKQERDMIRIPAYQQSVITGLILSDGWLTFATKTSKSARLGFKQSLSHSNYFWSVFSILSPYCSSIPNFVISSRKGTNTYAFQILTRSLPCFTELHSIYYSNGIKIVPADIFNLLTPVALAHWICGDGAKTRHGLTLSTESFSINDTVKLLNVLMIKYRLDCNLRKHGTSYTIYIKEKSLPLLRTLVQPYMHSSMLYKLKINIDDTTQVSSPPLPPYR